ncbi:MAG: UvrD-helicase domain-containing protein [Candidatus Gracilibacteria bacterium]|nr:UvrD-helicase domain-containing protein [Candidatus Gracilibacteria bacterium]
MLNPRQEEAKQCINGPLLIIAGAGSGKTTTLTARVEHMITDCNIDPENILCVTFTNKAAGELRHKLAKILNKQTPRSVVANNFPLVGTFHSIGVYFLRQFIDTLGYDKNFLIYDSEDQKAIIKDIYKYFHLEEKLYPIRQIHSYISNAKNHLISVEQYEAAVQSDIQRKTADVYKMYEERLKKNNALDFDDILIKTLEILKNPEILEILQEKYKYILVDEYQDTNEVQYRIINKIAYKYKNLCVVGDDWQSIYSWRGANMQNILNFKRDYENAKIIKLEQNYRSTKNIISAANNLIKNNKSALEKTLFTENEIGEKIKIIETFSDREEAKRVANIIKEKSNGKYSDNLILYRTNGQSRALEEALIYAGIPYKIYGGFKFYDRKEIKDLLAYLRTIQNPKDEVSIRRIINTPKRKIGDTSVQTIVNYVNAFGEPFITVIANIDEVEELNNGAKNNIRNFYNLMNYFIENKEKLSLSELLQEIINKTEYEQFLRANFGSDEVLSKIENIDELVNQASKFDGMDTQEALDTFLEEVALLTDLDRQAAEGVEDNFVTLMTLHTSKGLEFNRVFITGLEEGIFPHARALEDNTELEEERRLMYVGVTRAKKEAFLLRSKERFSFGNYIQNPPSRFLGELPEENIEKEELQREANFFNNPYRIKNTTNASSSKTSGAYKVPGITKKTFNNVADFSSGNRVEHPKFGQGVITNITGELATISFSGFGTKKMSLKIAPIKKI